MIHNLADFESTLDGRLGGAGRGPLSLLRIVVWTVVGLILIGLVWPQAEPRYSDNRYQAKTHSPLSLIVTLDKNDPRGFKKPPHRSRTFTIAWIGPSTLQSISKTKGETFIPADVRERIPKIDGLTVHMDIFFMSGARIMDLYSATKAALHSHPNMIVLDLNPVWIYNTSEVQSWTNLNGLTATYMAKSPRQWSLGAQFFSPADVTTGFVGRALPAVRNRWSYAQIFNSHLGSLSVLDTSVKPPASKGPLTGLDQVASMTDPLTFWVKYKFAIPTVTGVPTSAEREVYFLHRSVTTGGTVNDDVVNHLLGILAKAKMPAYVYVPPIAPVALKDPALSAALGRIEKHLAAQAARNRGPLLQVTPYSLARVLPPMKFNDLVHVAEDGPLVDYLAHAVCAHLLATHTATSCPVLPPLGAAK